MLSIEPKKHNISDRNNEDVLGLFTLPPEEREEVNACFKKIKQLEAERMELENQLLLPSIADAIKDEIKAIRKQKNRLIFAEDKKMTHVLNDKFPQFSESTVNAIIDRKEKKILISFFPCDDINGIKKIFDAFCSKIEYKKTSSLYSNMVSLEVSLDQRDRLLRGIELIPDESISLIDAPSMAKC